jgi:hypothetical protein
MHITSGSISTPIMAQDQPHSSSRAQAKHRTTSHVRANTIDDKRLESVGVRAAARSPEVQILRYWEWEPPIPSSPSDSPDIPSTRAARLSDSDSVNMASDLPIFNIEVRVCVLKAEHRRGGVPLDSESGD